MKILVSAPQKDGRLVSKAINVHCIGDYNILFMVIGRQFEVGFVQSVLMKVGVHERRYITLLWTTTIKR